MGKQWKTAGKQLQAAKKGALFMRLSRAIQAAVRVGGANAEGNHRLKMALDLARSHSLPKDTIERAIQKGMGTGQEGQLEEVVYEGFGPHGVAVIICCLTDNRTRTVSEIRYLFKKHKGNMSGRGSVLWMFDHRSDGSYVAKTPLSVDLEKKEEIKDFLSAFEDNPDCQIVYSNYV